MRSTRAALLVALGLWAMFPASAPAAVPTRDVVATGAYLRAQDADALEMTAELNASVAALEGRSDAIARECPAVLTYAPRDEAFAEFGEETIAILSDAFIGPWRATQLRTSKTIGALRWSNRKLTRLVHRLAAEERGLATITLPDVCGEIATWKASDYAALPESVSRFFAVKESIESERYLGPSEELREAAIRRMLRPYDSPADRRIAEHLAHLEAEIDRRFSSAITSERRKLGEALGASSL